MNRRHRPHRSLIAGLAALALLATALVAVAGPAGAALQQAGRTARVVLGADNDNAENTFIQPAGVAARQHMENADVIVGSRYGELLLGRKGSDVIEAGYGNDIMLGGLDKGAPNSDVLFGSWGNDYNIWAPGDGNDAFLGGPGYDVHINSAVEQANGEVALFRANGRTVPRALIDQQTTSCSVEAVPAQQGLGFDYITRFLGANGNVIVTIRLKDVELLVCNSAQDGMARFAVLRGPAPQLVERPLAAFRGTLLGGILGA
jgi:RTX calcium-binding nonapeptide repeat (4 copies)